MFVALKDLRGIVAMMALGITSCISAYEQSSYLIYALIDNSQTTIPAGRLPIDKKHITNPVAAKTKSAKVNASPSTSFTINLTDKDRKPESVSEFSFGIVQDKSDATASSSSPLQFDDTLIHSESEISISLDK